MRERRVGDDGLLLDFARSEHPARSAARAADALRAAAANGLLAPCDVVACAETVLVESLPGRGIDELGVLRVVREAGRADGGDRADGAQRTAPTPVMIPTVYDGTDLSDAAAEAGCSTAHLIGAHCAITWRVQFVGFAPGFGYLVPDDTADSADAAIFVGLRRRTQSRPSVPAGSVAVAAGHSAVYPRESPGGWHLIGRTSAPMWDSAADPPALLTAGALVRFTQDFDREAEGP